VVECLSYQLLDICILFCLLLLGRRDSLLEGDVILLVRLFGVEKGLCLLLVLVAAPNIGFNA
jgi:hypothetical protein